MNARARLTLADLKTATKAPAPAPPLQPSPAPKLPDSDKKLAAIALQPKTFEPKPQFNYAEMIREFEFPDGRQVAIHKHTVLFCTPFKEDQDHTLVGVRGGEKPLPLKIKYSEFLGWWSRGR